MRLFEVRPVSFHPCVEMPLIAVANSVWTFHSVSAYQPNAWFTPPGVQDSSDVPQSDKCVCVRVCVSLWGVLHWAYLTLSPSAPFQSHILMWLPRYCSLGMQIKFCEEMFSCGCFPQQKYPFNHHQYSYSSTMNILHVLTPTFTIWKWEFGLYMSGLVFPVHMFITVFVLFSCTNPSTILKMKSV